MEVWVEMAHAITDACYYWIMDIFVVPKKINNNFIVLPCNKAFQMYFSYNIIM